MTRRDRVRRFSSALARFLCAGALALLPAAGLGDYNWPWAPPPDAVPPRLPQPTVDHAPDDDCKTLGSILECQSQVMGEDVPIVGTPFLLHYASDRTPGRKAAYQTTIQLSDATPPSGLVRIDLAVTIAGRRFTQSFPPSANQSTTFAWDGKDAYGRPVQGGARATIRIGYAYAAVYTQPYTLTFESFGLFSGQPLLAYSARAGRMEAILYQEFGVGLGTLDALGLGLGGWTLDVHHVYDPTFGTLYRGDGARRDAANVLGSRVVTRIAGIGSPGYNGDGQPATSAALSALGVVAAPDGSFYVADPGNCRLRWIGPDGIIHTIAGTGLTTGSACDLQTGGNGDGGPAVFAKVEPRELALGPDGSLYFTEQRDFRVRRIGRDGIVTTIAGNGTLPVFDLNNFNGDGGPATQAAINPQALALGPDGAVYVVDLVFNPSAPGERYWRVRRVGTDGIISNFAGGAFVAQFGGDGGAAAQATFPNISGLAVAPDGGVLISSSVGPSVGGRVRRVGTDGVIRTIAGNGSTIDGGDGGPATQAGLSTAGALAVAPDGTIYIADNIRVRRVGPDGIISTFAGNGRTIPDQDNVPATLVTVAPFRLAVFPDGTLCMSENNRVRRVGSALPTLGPLEILVASEDGDELYVFNAEGLHFRTLHALTAAVRYQFAYDAGGRLTTVTDGDGNVTAIFRDGSGHATAIVAPGGQRTTLVPDASGRLVSIVDPAGATAKLAYTADGLLVSRLDPRGNPHQYAYDALGRLVRETEPTGGVKTLARLDSGTGYVVTLTTPLGRTTSYQIDFLGDGSVRRVNSDAAGAQTVVVTRPDGSQSATLPDGSTITLGVGPDPRFGMMAPRLLSRRRTLPGGQVESMTGTHSATLSDPTNLLSLATQTDTVTINGRVFTRSYAAATRTLTDTSAEGRQTSLTLDAQARVVRSAMGAGVTPVTVTYDAQGRIVEQRQGTQFWSFAWDARNRMVSRSDAAGRTFTYGYDDADRVVTKTLPSGATYGFAYDASGNLTDVFLPSGGHHVLAYTPLDQDASYTPPGNGSYTRAYDLDRMLAAITLPGGRVRSQGYDAAGRVASLGDVDAVTTFTYLPGDPTERAGSIAHVPATGVSQTLALAYDGDLVSGVTATGAAPSQTGYAFDNNLFLSQLALSSGADTFQAAVAYDRDGLLSAFGPFTFSRAGPGGATSQITDGTATTAYGYDGWARVVSRSHLVSGVPVYALQLAYDVAGRITAKTETVGATVHSSVYSYAPDGQLVGVTRDGIATESYGYDLNGNRVSRILGGSLETATYDGQDRLLGRGGTAYAFDADGFLTRRGSDSFQYNARSQLVAAVVGGQPVAYGYDGLGRRVTRTDAAGTAQYFYGDLARPFLTAMRSAAGEFTTFWYDDGGLLVALERGGNRYHVACDQIGTPRVVSDASGAIVKSVEYDAFGNPVADSNPSFVLDIGWAGGLQDAATGLVHFGARDYDPAAGRWTARDPVLFGGGQGNLYVYVGNDPVDARDPTGLFCVSAVGYDGVGGGVQTCITGDGASVCFEVGFGFGVSAGVDTGGLQGSGSTVGAELKGKCGPIGGGVDVKLDDTGCLSFGGSGPRPKSPLPVEVNDGKGKLKLDVDADVKVKLSAKCSAEGKVYGKICKQGKF